MISSGIAACKSNDDVKDDIDNSEKDRQANIGFVNALDGTTYQLTGFNKSSADEAGVFKVRVFSNTALAVKIDGNEAISATTEKGKVTTHFSIDDCATGLNVGGNSIDFCNDAVFGNSYLVVVDSSGKVVVAQE